ELAVELFEHRLHGADDEGKADEDERNGDAERGVGDLDAERFEQAADPAVRRVERSQRDAGDRRGQRKWKIDKRIEQAAAGKAVADQYPGDDDAEHRVDERGNERGEKAQAERRERARTGHHVEKAAHSELSRLQHEGAKRNEDDQAQIRQSETERQPESRDSARSLQRKAAGAGHGVFPQGWSTG